MIARGKIMAALSRRALFGFALLLLPLAGALPAWADALDDALKAGLVGETREGYIAPIQNPPAPEITALVNMLRPYGVVDVVRTGKVAIGRGNHAVVSESAGESVAAG